MSRNDSLEISRWGNETFLCFNDGFTVAECFCGEELLHKLEAAPEMYEALKAHYDAQCFHDRHIAPFIFRTGPDVNSNLEQYKSMKATAAALTETAIQKAEGRTGECL